MISIHSYQIQVLENASCDSNLSRNPFEESSFQIQDFDPFSTSKSDEPLVQTFASGFDPFTPQATVESLDQSKESEKLLGRVWFRW